MRPTAQTPATGGWLGRNQGYCVAVLLAIAVYLPAFGGEPIWDDAIVFERYLPTFRSLGDAFFPPSGAGELGEHYYRPLVTLSYLFDVGLYGQERFVGHHLTTVLFHALTAVAVGLLTCRLVPAGPAARWTGFAAACCFAVHPVHVDSVAQISGRSDPMAATFVVASLLAVLRGRERPQRRWPWCVAGALFLAALLSKEVAAVGLVLGALLLWLPSRAPAAAWWRFAIAYGAAGVIYLILRSSVGSSSSPSLGLSLGEAVERLVQAVGYYAGMVTVPVGQAAFVPLSQLPSMVWGVISLLLITLAGLAAWRIRTTPTVLRVAWVWFVVTLSPALLLLFVKASEQPVAERYLYVPSVGVALAFGWLVGRVGSVPRASRAVAIVVALLLSVGAVVTALRSRIYVDNLTFWTDTVAKAPATGLPEYQLGLTLRKAGRLDEALQHLTTALELYDDAEGRSLALNTIGTIHIERREWEAAADHFRRSADERADYATPWFNLASVYGMRSETRRDAQGAPDLADLERCVEALEQAIARRGDYEKARAQLARQSLTLAKVYLVHNRREDSNRVRERARAAAQWLVQRDPRGALGQQGQAVLQELERLPR